MKDEHKTKEQLINELLEMRQRAAELEASENERQRAEDALREGERGYRAIVEDQTELICRFRPDGTLTFVNEAYCRYFGKKREELIGHSCMPLIPEEDREFVASQFTSLSIENPTVTYEHQAVAASGEICWQQWTDRAIFDECGHIVEYQSVGHDTTDRKRAEEEVRQRNRELAALNAIATTIMQSALGLDEVLQQIADGVVEGLGCNTGLIFLLDEKEGIFRGSAVSTKAKILERLNAIVGFPLLQIKIPARRDFNEAMGNLLAGRTTIKRNLHELVGPLLSKRVCSAMQRLLDSRSFFSIPLLAKGKTVGGIVASTPQELSEEDAAKLMTFANQAAIAIENARLFEAERKRSTQLGAVARVAERIASILNPDELLRETVELITQTFGYFYAAIMLLDAEANELVFNVGAGAYAGKTPAGFRQKVKEGMIGWAAHLGQTIWANDVSQEPRYIPAYLSETRAELDVPLKYHDRVIGVLDLQSQELNAFTQHDVMAMETLAGHVAAAIENARLYQEIRQRALEQETLREAALALTTALDRNRVIERILTQLQQVVPYDSASVQLLRENRMEIVGGRGFLNLPDLLGITFPVNGDNPNSEVVRTRAPFIVHDAPTIHEGFRKDPHRRTIIHSWLGVPMLIGEKLVGMIALDKSEPGFYTPRHARLAEAFAAQAAIAIENARLYEEEKRRATQLALISEVGEKAASILDLDRLMQEVTRSIQESFNYYNVALLLLDEERREVVMQAVTGGFEHIISGQYRQSLDEGIIGFTVRTGRSLLASDVSQAPHYVKGFLEEALTKSELCVPIKLGDKVIGALDLQSIHLNDFDQSDVVAMEMVADRVAIAIENARLFEEAEHLKAFNESVVQGVAEAILIEDAQGILTFANPAAEELLGYTREELIGRHWTTIVPEEQKENVGQELVKRCQGELSRYETALLSKGGQVIPVIVSARPLFENSEFAGVLSAFTDIRERMRAEREIEERQVYLEEVLRDAPDAIVTLDARHRIVEWNAGAERLFGYPHEEVIGRNLDDLVTNPAVFEEAIGFTQRALGGKALPPTEAVRYRKDGSPVHVIVAGSPIMVGDELIGVVAVYTDITARKRMEETLRALALIDELTGLYNRRGFFTLAEQQLKTADRAKSRMLLLFADFDGLKQINDAFGHFEGDQALIEVANVLRKKFRESDIIARIGGDEFVVLATETGGGGTGAITARLQENLEAINAREGRRYELALSVGIAHYDPEHPCSIDELLARADRAMYEKKRSEQKA